MQDRLQTERLLLRRLQAADGVAVQDLAGNWKVARMTARIPYPYPAGLAAQWVAAQDEAWSSGQGYAFALERAGVLAGVASLEQDEPGVYEIGYWLGEPWWGQGLMSEAAGRLVRYGFEDLRAEKLTAGHLLDNPASGRILDKYGFRACGQSNLWCEARREHRPCRRLALTAADFGATRPS